MYNKAQMTFPTVARVSLGRRGGPALLSTHIHI